MKKQNFDMKPIIDLMDNAIEKLNKPLKVCDNCDGDGYLIYSCCGDDIKGNDIDLCPTCYEHCGMEEEKCEECNGTGYINN